MGQSTAQSTRRWGLLGGSRLQKHDLEADTFSLVLSLLMSFLAAWDKQCLYITPFCHISVLGPVLNWNCEPKYTFPPPCCVSQVFCPSNWKISPYLCTLAWIRLAAVHPSVFCALAHVSHRYSTRRTRLPTFCAVLYHGGTLLFSKSVHGMTVSHKETVTSPLSISTVIAL